MSNTRTIIQRMVTILAVVSPLGWILYEAAHHWTQPEVPAGIITLIIVWVAVVLSAALERDW